jgi:hypothetical protein
MEEKIRLIRLLDTFIEAEFDNEDRLSLRRKSRFSCKELVIPETRWRFDDKWPDKSSYFDKSEGKNIEEDWNLSLRIRFVNQHMDGQTHMTDPCSRGDVHPDLCPRGLHVFKPSNTIVSLDVLKKLDALFAPGRSDVPRDGSSNIIFYHHKRGRHSPPYKETMEILQGIDVEIYSMVTAYASAIQKVLGATEEDLMASSMSMVRYDKRKGIRQHIDNITDPRGTVGPLVSIALGNGPKFLDLMPTLADNQGFTPVRVGVDQGDVIIMDGAVRLEYSHSVPYGNPSVMFSLLFKFREIRRYSGEKNQQKGETSGQLQTTINYTIDPMTGDIPVRADESDTSEGSGGSVENANGTSDEHESDSDSSPGE